MTSLKLHPSLYLDEAGEKGRGVYTNMDLDPMFIVENSSVLILNPKERKLIEQTALYNYIFEWGTEQDFCCVAWGYLSMYNHSYAANCEYCMDYDSQSMSIQTIRAIKKGEELTINYNGDWDNAEKVWFDTLDE